MKKVVLVFIVIFWTVYVAIVSAGFADKILNGSKKTNTVVSDASTMAGNVTLSVSEIAKHNKANDCWTTINNKVYNLSSYIGGHPGRADTILPYCGTDGTKGYNTKDKIIAAAHSLLADSLLAKYLLGEVGQTINGTNAVPVAGKPVTTGTTPTSNAGNAATLLSAPEVAKHNTAGNCWFIINQKVYNITAYFGSHPGGDNRLLKYCGLDATASFTGLPHSAYATALLGRYQVGSIGQSVNESNVNTTNTGSTQTPIANPNSVEEDDEDDE